MEHIISTVFGKDFRYIKADISISQVIAAVANRDYSTDIINIWRGQFKERETIRMGEALCFAMFLGSAAGSYGQTGQAIFAACYKAKFQKITC